ncbi:MAG TPA: hypothetical protein VKF60_15685 [Myxococcota bacterium]|nr:hypothetical protein [Myxococcota bacterium]
MRTWFVLLVALLAACKTVPLRDPDPVKGAPGPDLTLLAIHRAMALEGFVEDEVSPGLLRAHLIRGDWSMTVDIEYAERVRVVYAGSKNLSYRVRHGQKYIHRGYNARAQRLVEAIQREALLISAEVDPDAYLGLEPIGAPPPAPPPTDPAR